MKIPLAHFLRATVLGGDADTAAGQTQFFSGPGDGSWLGDCHEICSSEILKKIIPISFKIWNEYNLPHLIYCARFLVRTDSMIARVSYFMCHIVWVIV